MLSFLRGMAALLMVFCVLCVQPARASDPEDPDPPHCGTSCPEYCFVDITEANSAGDHLAVFYLFGLSAAPTSAELKLEIPGDVEKEKYTDLYSYKFGAQYRAHLPVPYTFDVYDVELIATVKFVVPGGYVTRTCGVHVEQE